MACHALLGFAVANPYELLRRLSHPTAFCYAERMKRVKTALKVLGIVVALFVIAAGAFLYDAFGGHAPMTDADLNPSVHVVRTSFSTVFVIDAGPGQVVLVDTGVNPEGTEILAALKARGMGPEAVKAIFITHGHSDHTAAVNVFRGAQVFALESERALIAGQTKSHSPVGRLQSMKPTGISLTRGLSDGEVVHVGEIDVKAYAVPGHTSGSAAFLARKALLMGDSSTLSSKDKVIGPVWMFSEDTSIGRQSLRNLGSRLRNEGADASSMGFAHSGGMQGDVIAALEAAPAP
jgi:glyoxylase-like metal-dependent hydrolase (beta-lactamase superfamily II)